MDPVSAVVGAVGDIFGGVVALIEGRRESRYGRLPDWLSPRDFSRNNYSNEMLLGGLIIGLVVVLFLINKAK